MVKIFFIKLKIVEDNVEVTVTNFDRILSATKFHLFPNTSFMQNTFHRGQRLKLSPKQHVVYLKNSIKFDPEMIQNNTHLYLNLYDN